MAPSTPHIRGPLPPTPCYQPLHQGPPFSPSFSLHADVPACPPFPLSFCPAPPSCHGFRKPPSLSSLSHKTLLTESLPALLRRQSAAFEHLRPLLLDRIGRSVVAFFLSGEHCRDCPTSPFPLIVQRLMPTTIPRSCRVAVKPSETMRRTSPLTNATGPPFFPPPQRGPALPFIPTPLLLPDR
jgi:hypothetical protein